MIHFQTRDDILRWLTTHCPRKAIVRSLLQDRAELLGGFSNIPPSGRPGWIVRVTSLFLSTKIRTGEYSHRKWIVAVIPCIGKPDYEIRILNRVPWKSYLNEPATNSIYGGDRPWLYRILKEGASDA